MRVTANVSSKERRFVYGVNLSLVEKLVLPMFLAFILLNLADALTTLVAFKSGLGFVEFNPFAVYLFSRAFAGFMVAYAFKLVPAVPLLYMIFVSRQSPYDYEVGLLRLTALTVLSIADVYFGMIVFGNNLPNLVVAGII